MPKKIRKKKCYWCKKIIRSGGITAKAYKFSYFMPSVPTIRAVGKRKFHKGCHSKMVRILKNVAKRRRSKK